MISADVSFTSITARDVTHRREGGETELTGIYVVYYPFGLNTPNMTFGIRKFIDVLRGSYAQH